MTSITMERPERRLTIRWPPNPNHLLSTICFLYTILSSSFVLCCSARDTITKDSLLRDGETLVSAGNRFELGFFNATKSSEGNRRYVGIWYYNSNPPVVVWVANREYPLPVSTGVFTIADDGNLKILDANGTVYWDTECEKSSPLSRVAKLMDSGNLVLTDDRLAMSSWESFKQPTDTFLPGMKMDENLNLTSWTSQDDPKVGNFTFQTVGNQYRILKKYFPYWKSGEPGKSFTEDEMPPSITKFLSNLSQNLNVKRSIYDHLNMSTINLNNSRLTMSFTGHIQLWSKDKVNGWSLVWYKPRDTCNLINHCGKFGICNSSNKLECTCLKDFMPVLPENWDSGDYTGGCLRKSELCLGKDMFLSLKKVKVETESFEFPAKNETDCLEQCRNTCQCQAYSYDEAKNNTRRGDTRSTTTCLLWTDDLSGIQEEYTNDGPDLHVRVAASDTENGNTRQDGGGYTKRGRKKWTLIVGVTVAGVIILSSTIVYFYLRRKNVERQENRESIRQNMAARFYDSARHVKDLVDTDQFKEEDKRGIDLPFFDFESILAATDNFSESNMLGKGGFGPVYKGKFPGGEEIAVKRLSSVSRQGLEEFKNEVVLIARLQHRNLVRLLGYCIEGGEMILLYEYMPNKSLDSFIFDPVRSELLDWEMRFNIILGIARGLLYLHQDSRLRIIHRDLKTSNVLLDQEMNPKISDFGLARIFEGKQTEGSTSRVVGTYGYMSPEYALDGFFSVKSDVFSFGVVVLEIVSGKRNTGYSSGAAASLLGYTWKSWQEDKALDIMDQKLSASSKRNEILKCLNVGLLCVQEDPNDRPNMSNVVIMLGSETETLPTPKRPAFVLRREPSSNSASSSSKQGTNTASSLMVSFTGR